MEIVEADIELRAGFRRDHVESAVAGFDRGNLEVRSVKILRALVERFLDQGRDGAHQLGHRVVGKMRIGDVALLPADDQCAGERAPPADLHHVAESGHVGRFADDTVVELLAALIGPAQELAGAVYRGTFLVSGDQEGNRAVFGLSELHRGVGKGRDCALHVAGAAPEQFAVGDIAGKGRVRPVRNVAGRHHIGMTREYEMRRAATDFREQVVDIRRVRIRERHTMHLIACIAQNPAQRFQRAAFRGRHGRAADQRLRDFDCVRIRHARAFASPGSLHRIRELRSSARFSGSVHWRRSEDRLQRRSRPRPEASARRVPRAWRRARA